MEQLIVDRLGSASLSNGVVRIQCQSNGADGQPRPSAELLIPVNQFGQIVGGLQQAGQQLQEKMAAAQQEQAEGGAETSGPTAGEAESRG